MVNPESSQDAEDNVVVTDDAAEEQVRNAEIPMGAGMCGRPRAVERVTLWPWPLQDKDKDDENKNSDSEGEEEEDEESEEERDKDVDPGFREQLMEVLRAGKALVSWGRAGDRKWVGICPLASESKLMTLPLRVKGTVRTMGRSWMMRP